MATCALAKGERALTVHFIGAGPGAPDLITLRGRDLIASCPVCLYAGSLVPEGNPWRIARMAPRIHQHRPDGPGCHCRRLPRGAPTKVKDVARLHSGDLSVWSAMGEQIRRLREEGIPVSVTPGVPSFAAAAAALWRPN